MKIKCRRPGCNVTFEVKGTGNGMRKYCSIKCGNMVMDERARKSQNKRPSEKGKMLLLHSGLEVKNNVMGMFMMNGD